MGRIKGWRDEGLLGESNRVWRNETRDNVVTVEKFGRSNEWVVMLYDIDKNQNDIEKELGNSKTKKQAEMLAIKWMRKHPKG